MVKNGLQKKLEAAEKTLEEMKLQLLYVQFDLEATRRERDYYKKLSEEK